MASKLRILFVDDEPILLRGLRHKFDSMIDKWDMEFAESGKEALEIMNNQKFDVVVTDMKMPYMNGAELLEEVKKRSPETIRIILSGYTNLKMFADASKTSHYFLSKPIDTELFKNLLLKAGKIQKKVAGDDIKRLLLRIDTFPTLPALYLEIKKKIRSSNSAVKEVAQLISKDMSITSKILKLVNSAYFGLSQPVSNIHFAVTLLGLDMVKNIVLAVGVFSQFDSKQVVSLHIDELWEHSIKVATTAKEIAKLENFSNPVIDDAFTSGLLHDIGKLVFIDNFPDRYQESMNLVKEKNITTCEAEDEIFNTNHSELGGYLMQLWGLPKPVANSVRYHHCPNKGHPAYSKLLSIIHCTNVFDHASDKNAEIRDNQKIDNQFMDEVGLSGNLYRWESVCNKVKKEEISV